VLKDAEEAEGAGDHGEDVQGHVSPLLEYKVWASFENTLEPFISARRPTGGRPSAGGCPMQLTLFKALQSIKLSDEAATAVVDQIEEHIAMKINEATKGLEMATKALEAKLDSTSKGLEAQLRAMTWLIGSFGVIISLIGVMGAVATFGPPIQKMLGY
jgi:hypothetical protein